MAESIINSGLTKEMLDMTYPDEYYKNTIQPAKAGTGQVPSKTQMMYQNLKSGGPFKAMRIGMDPYLPGFMQQGYDKFRAAPTSAARTALGAGSGILRTAASLPMQAAMAGPYAISKAMAPSVAAGDFVNDEQFQLGQSEVGVGDFYSGNTNLLTNAEKAMMADEYDVGNSFANNERITPNIPGNVPSNFVDAGRNFSMFDQAKMGNSRSNIQSERPNIQSENYNMDQSFYMNPNSVEQPQNMFQRVGGAMQDGIGSIRDFAVDKGMSAKNLLGSGAAIAMGLPGIVGSSAMSLLGGFGNMFEDRQLSGDGTIVDEYGRSYNASDLNKQNALGGYYTDAARGSRRRGKSIQTMLERQTKEGLSRLGEKRLAKLQAQEALQEQSRQAAARQMQDSNRANNTGGYQAGYSSDFMEGPDPSASNQDLTSTMGSFKDGGLASMFVRRR